MKRPYQIESGDQLRINRRVFLARAIATSTAGIAAATFLQSCSSADAAASSLNFANWASAETATRSNIDKALQAFEATNKVQVNNIGISFDDMLTEVSAMTKADISPDVIELSGNWPFELGGTGKLVDLTPYINQEWRQDAFPDSFQAGTYKDMLYAVPFSITPHGFWYNKNLLQQAGLEPTTPPKTISDLNQIMALLRDRLPNDTYPLGIDTSQTEYALVGFWPWIWTFGGQPLVEDSTGKVTVNWTDDGTVQAFQWLQDAVKNRWTPEGLAIKDERTLMAFDKLVFKLDGPYLTGTLGALNPALNDVQKVNARFSVTTTPLGPGRTQPVTCADIHQLSISSLAQDKDLAWKLINFLTTAPAVIQSFLIPEGGVLPYKSYNISAQRYAKYYSDPISQNFIAEVIPTMRPVAYGVNFEVAAKAIVSALQDIARGAGVQARLRKLNNEVKSIYY